MGNPDRLLVVDDDAYNRDMLSRRLYRRGYEVTVAVDGNEALALIEEKHFDLVLLDNMMPGLSGLDLLRLLRATYNPTDLPVIMVTAQSESDNIVQALKAGANDYVEKPVDFPVAAARIQKELARRTTAAALRESEERYALAACGAQDGCGIGI
jgi:DNA-binding response OmpR family regulator